MVQDRAIVTGPN